MNRERQKTTIGNQTGDLLFEGERLITPNTVGHNMSSQPKEGFISPFLGKVEFLDVENMPEPKVFHADDNEMSLIQ